MNIKRPIERKSSFNILFILLTIFCLFSCQPLPKNIGMSASTFEIGIVYTAKVKAIYPIFVESFVNHSYADGIGEAAGALVDDALQGSAHAFKYSVIAANLVSTIASTTTGIYEERYAGFYCHYILEVNDESLIEDIQDTDNSDYYDDDSSNRYNDNYYSNNDGFEETNYNNETLTHVEIDENSGFTSGNNEEYASDSSPNENQDIEKNAADIFKEQLEALVASNIEKEKKIRQLMRDKKKLPKIFVVNPCRNFPINSSVTVSKSENTVILQPNFLESLR